MRKYLLLSILLSVFSIGAAAQPAAITDLTATSTIAGQAQLTWTSPDPADGLSTPSSYLVKYATADISSSDFYSSCVSTYTQSWTTLVSSGAAESRMLTGLTPGATLYFAIKACNSSAEYGIWQSSGETGGTSNPLARAVIAALAKPQFSGETAVLGYANLKWAWSLVSYAEGYRVINSSSGVNISGDLSASATYWIQPNLSANTSSTVYVEAFSGLISSDTASRTQYTLVRAPTIPQSSETTSSIDLSWNKNSNPDYTRYSVLRSTDNFSHSVTVMSLARSTTHQDTGLVEGATYQYCVWAVNEESVASTTLNYSTHTASIPPAQSSFFIWNAGTNDGEVTLRWLGSGDDGTVGSCSSYVLKWATYTVTESNFSDIAVSSMIVATKANLQPEPAHTISNLNPGTTYYFAFRAYDEVGNFSPISDVEAVPACDNPPLPPTGASAVIVSSCVITVSWILPSFVTVDDRDKYEIDRSSTSASFLSGVNTFTVNHPQTSFNDTGLQAETTYYYRVRCLDKGDQENGLFSLVLKSNYSSVVSTRTPDTTLPAAIAQISAQTGAAEGKIDLSWVSPGDDGSSGNITGGKFRIDWDMDAAKGFAVGNYKTEIATNTTPGTTNAITVSSLGEGVTYYFRIWTADEAGNWSPVSAGATAWSQVDVTSPTAVGNLAATAGWREIRLNWTAPGDDGSTGTLNGQYDIRLSTTGAIDDLTKWNAVPAEYPYRIVKSTQAVPGTSQMALITGLANGTTCYFALRSADERGNWSGLSTVLPSTAPFNNVPAAFALQQPLDTAVANTLQPTFSWGASSDADTPYGDVLSYTLTYSTDNAFPLASADTVVVPGISGTSYMPTLSLGTYEDKTVYWKVTAADNDGGVRLCSQGSRSVQINSQNSLPASFTLTAPASGTTITAATPTLSWTSSSDVDPGDSIRYRVDYSRDNFATFTSSAGISANIYVTPQLVENATYWWRVWAVDASSASTPCVTTFYFKVNAVAEPPLAFSLSAPGDNLIMSTSTVTFTWQSTADPDPGDTVSYDLSWSESQEFVSSTTVTGLTKLTTTYAGFTENGIYYWRVTAVGSDGQRRQSTQIWRFYIDAKKDLPGAFDLLEPGYNVTISTTVTPLFSWGKAIDPDPADDVRYIIDLSPSPDFTGLGTVAVDRGSDRYYVPLIGLTDQTTYYWRVRASGYQGNPIPVQVDPKDTYTYSSTTGTFVISMVNNPPDNFALTSPVDKSDIATKKPTFKWGAAYDRDVGASVTYTIFISSAADFSVILESATGLSSTSYEPQHVLLENRSFYWKVRADDNKNMATDCTSVFSFNVPVLNVARAPAGLQGTLAADKMSFTIQWSPVGKNSNNSAIDDLAGYRIYRGLSPQKMSYFAATGPDATGWTDSDTQGGAFYYRIRAFDTSGIESALEDSPLLNSLSADSLNMMSEDLSLSIAIPPTVARLLLAGHNTYQEDLSIKFEHNAAAENDTTLLSYRIKVLKADGTDVGRISFDQPLVLTFNYGAGTPAAAKLAAAKASSQDYGNMNVFWNNGIEYMRLGGVCDSREKNIALKAIKPGEYQLRRVSRPTSFRVSTIDPPKLFTPGIAPYEKITFYVDNPDGDKVLGKVFNLRGEFVADLRPNGDATSSNVILEWDGATSDSGAAPKGVYIYQIEGSGKILNGTIMIAR